MGERGVPSFVATGPIGGRGAPSGRWALTLIHKPNSNLTAMDALMHSVPTGWAVEGQSSPTGGQESQPRASGPAAEAPAGETTMLQQAHRLCAAEVWRGHCLNKKVSLTKVKNIKNKKVGVTTIKNTNSRKAKWDVIYFRKKEEGLNKRRENNEGAGIVPRFPLSNSSDPRQHETIKRAHTSLHTHRPDAHTTRLLRRPDATLACYPHLHRPRAGAATARPLEHAACCGGHRLQPPTATADCGRRLQPLTVPTKCSQHLLRHSAGTEGRRGRGRVKARRRTELTAVSIITASEIGRAHV